MMYAKVRERGLDTITSVPSDIFEGSVCSVPADVELRRPVPRRRLGLAERSRSVLSQRGFEEMGRVVPTRRKQFREICCESSLLLNYFRFYLLTS